MITTVSLSFPLNNIMLRNVIRGAFCYVKFRSVKSETFYDIWEYRKLDLVTIKLLRFLLEKKYLSLRGRIRKKDIIHIGLDEPSSSDIGNQTLMFGPAGNFLATSKIIITGISTSITSANGIAEELKEMKHFTIDGISKAYLKNVYKGRMYKNFKRTWLKASKGSEFEQNFLNLFEMIEGSKPINRESIRESAIMVTQLTLHGIATYCHDRRHNRISWSTPSTQVFKSNLANKLYEDFFVENVLMKRFLLNPCCNYLFVMGNDAYNKVKKTIRDLPKQYQKDLDFKEEKDEFSLKDFKDSCNSKIVIKVPHPAS